MKYFDFIQNTRNDNILHHARKRKEEKIEKTLIERRADGVPAGHSHKSELPYSVNCY
jgi:hypothetical protein